MKLDYVVCLTHPHFAADIATAKARLGSMSWDFARDEEAEDPELYTAMVLTYAMYDLTAKKGIDDPDWREFMADALSEALEYAMHHSTTEKQ